MYSSIGTTKAAFLAAGGVLKAAELVAKGEVEAAFAIVRPPGHHVGINGPPRGFCFFNNVSIAAAHLLNKHGIKKILLLDWDIHHGDGTQEIFYGDNRVLFFSLHRADHNFYPNSKKGLDNLGKDSGLGYNINICWRHNKIRDVDYHAVWDHLLVPITQEFKPEMILISSGFGAAKGDRLGKCDVTPNGFATLLRKLRPLAPVVMALEGGYNVVAISQSAAACLKVLLGDKRETVRDRGLPYATTRSLIVEAKEKLRPYWKCLASAITEDVMANTISAPRTAEPQLP